MSSSTVTPKASKRVSARSAGARPGMARSILVRGYAVVLLALVAAALLASVLPFQDPNAQSLAASLLPPLSEGHLLGTDQLGRDILSRLVHGAQLTILLAVGATTISAIFGSIVGMVAGYRRGWVDAVISRLVDAQLALPFILLALAVISATGRSIVVLLLVLSAIAWAQFARLVRAEVLSLREQPFVMALRAAGLPPRQVIFRHLLPNVMPTIGVVATLQIATMILAESALSFLGLGVAPPSFTWGSMLADGKDLLQDAWWISGLPGLLITLTVLHVSVIGDMLKTRFDPRMKQR